ncbi:hypothetical protein JCM10207_003589 [Rhodosporidiobolus poonsookiae]
MASSNTSPPHSAQRAHPPSSASTASTPQPDGNRLRARKLSLSTQQLPLASTSGSLFSPSTTSPVALSPQEVGLGLMLDENGLPSPRVSLDSSVGGRSRGNSLTKDRKSDETDDFFLAATGGAGEGSGVKRTPSGRMPRLSTVTTQSGATSSPLAIYTGSPVPAQYPSPLPSPVPTPRSFSPSPSHTAYNLSSTVTSAPMSRPPSYNTIMASSMPMDRSRSGGSDIHSRQQSLTSACPPVTAGGLGTPKPDVAAFGSPSMGSTSRGGWRPYDWGVSSEKGYDSGEDVREGGKRRTSSDDGVLGKVLALPGSVLSVFLRPLNGSPGGYARHPHSPTLNGSSPSKPSASGPLPSRRYPLPIRLVTMAYLIFSFLYLTLSLTSTALAPSAASASAAESQSRLAALRARLGARGGAGQEGWQLVREYADGLGAKAGLDLGWTRYKSDEKATEEESPAWGPVRRVGNPDADKSALTVQDPQNNPLTPFTHTYRFSKMHEKIHWDLHDEIVPFAFHALAKPEAGDITACLYSNEAWLDVLPSFVRAWHGPVSLVFEAPHSRHDQGARSALLARISALRESDQLIKRFVDFHLVGAPSKLSERALNKTRERMIKNPVALNYQLNLARFFSQSDMVFLVGDARITPSNGLRRKLTTESTRNLLLERGDALVVPTFGFIRDPTGQPTTLGSIPGLRQKLGLVPEETAPEPTDDFNGVGADEFAPLAAEHVHTLFETLPLQQADWPARKQNLVSLVNTRVPSVDSPTTAQLALFDKRWDLNHGPSNWYLWRKSSADPRLQEQPSSGGGLGLGLDGAVGGGREVYRVVDYDLHYAPLVVVSKKGQPWCTERFDDVRAACVYQMYLSGAEMWVVPDEWAYTLEVLEKKPEGVKEDPAEKLKNSISSRLYGKFHQEACMHYGREFLSIAMWDSDKAQHLRETCARTLGSWGMGSV